MEVAREEAKAKKTLISSRGGDFKTPTHAGRLHTLGGQTKKKVAAHAGRASSGGQPHQGWKEVEKKRNGKKLKKTEKKEPPFRPAPGLGLGL